MDAVNTGIPPDDMQTQACGGGRDTGEGSRALCHTVAAKPGLIRDLT